MLRKTLALAVLALAIPAVALAAKPTTHTSQSKSTDNTRGIVKFRAAKKQTSSGLSAALAPNSMTALQIVAR